MAKKPTLVLLPGMLCDARLFEPQIAALENDYEVIIGDLFPEQHISAIADRLLAQLPERFSLAGLSMGGIVAMQMVAQAPDRLERLALLDTNHLPDAPERKEIRDRQVADVKAGLLKSVVADEMKPNYLAKCNRTNQALLDLLVQMALDLGSDVFISQSLALRSRPDQTGALSTFQKPTLVVCGEEDALCTPERHRQMATLVTNSTLTFIENAGHITTLENPDAVNLALKKWLSTLHQ